MKRYDFETWDVFTDQRFAGNQLAVVMNAHGLTTNEMQAITREFNLAETSFVLPPEDKSHTARVRIFTLGYEMPFAGHPTVGTAIAIAASRKLANEVTLELNAGLFPVKIDLDGDHAFAQFKNPNLPAETGLAPDAAMLEAALSLRKGIIDRGAHQPRRVGAGVDFVYAHAPFDDVRKARVNSAAFDQLGLDGPVGVYLYGRGGEAADADWHVRMFAPGAGILEDPATGSAAAALPGQIALSEQIPDGAHKWNIEQGFEMGRPSQIAVEIETTNNKIRSVRVGGNAIPVSKGQILV